MDFKKAAVLASLVLVCTLAVVPMSESDADTQVGDVWWDLDTMKGGSIWIDLKGTSSDFTAEVKITENGNQIYKENHKVTRGDCTLEIYLPNMKSAGDHSIVIYLECADGSGAEFDHPVINKTIHVDTNILSNWTTYLAIIIAVIVIGAIIYLRLRDKPKVENTMTFEQLEEERKAEMAAKSENRGKKKSSAQAPAASTEKKRYSGKKKQ